MLTDVRAIVLSKVKHSDRFNVLSLYSPELGRFAVLAPEGGNTKTARINRARLQPLCVIETQLNVRQGRELQKLRRFTPMQFFPSLYFDPLKRTVAFFLAEFLNRLLRESGPDENLWEYILRMLGEFDGMEQGCANFHVVFLWHIMPHLGINPDLESYREGYMFDMRQGSYVATDQGHSDMLRGEAAMIPRNLSRLTTRNLHLWHTNGAARKAVLDVLLRYFSVHLPGLGNLRSADILRELGG